MGEQLDLGIKGPRNIRMELSDKEREITQLSRAIVKAKDEGRDVTQAEAELKRLEAEFRALTIEFEISKTPN